MARGQTKRFNYKRKVSRSAQIFVVLLGALSMVTPFLWMISTSLKDDSEVFTWPPHWIPERPLFTNYLEMWNAAPFGRYILNSAIVAVTVTIVVIFLSSLGGFAFAKYIFPGRNAIFILLLSTMMIPGQVTLIPVFIIVKNFGWLDTYQGLIVPSTANVFGLFLMRQFMKTIPNDLLDAPRMDGCGEFRIYSQIVMPLCKPILATLIIFVFMWQWNSLFWPLIVTHSEDMKTLQLGLAGFKGEWMVRWNLLMAGSTMGIIPIFLLFISFQRYFIEGITLTGLKS